MNHHSAVPDLSSARRALDKAQDAYQNAMLSSAVRGTGASITQGHGNTDSAEWRAAYYSSSSLKAFSTRFLAFYKSDNIRATYAQPAYVAVVSAWQVYDVARLAEKARKVAGRAVRAAKQDQKAALNLQPGVSLKGVDVGQYQVILAGLEPVRLHVLAVTKKNLRQDFARMIDLLHANNWNPKLVAEWQEKDTFNGRTYTKYPEHFHALFVATSESSVAQRSDSAVVAYIHIQAEQFALAYVQGYAAKLAVKTGEALAADQHTNASLVRVLSASVSSSNLWSDSVAVIKIDDGRTYRFHTQMIWNRSCLGTQFNQWPTRRVA